MAGVRAGRALVPEVRVEGAARRELLREVGDVGELGVAVFIGIPLPGSGVYTGAFGSYLIGLSKRKFAIANVIGVVIAAAAVTA